MHIVHFTTVCITQKCTICNFCNEQGYLSLDNDFYFLVVNKRIKEE